MSLFYSVLFTVLPSLIFVMFICLLKKSDCFSLCLQLQIKHAVTQAEIQLLKRKVSLFNTHLYTCRQKTLKTTAYSGCTAEENVHMHNTSSFWLYDDLMPPTYHLLLPHWPPPRLQLAHAEQDKLRWRMERAQLEQNIRDSKERMEKLEGYWMEAQSLCKVR